MIDSIFVERDGVRTISMRRLLGKGYTRGRFTNCKCRYRFFVGARATKKSRNMIGNEPIIKILSDERRNVVICRQNDVDNRQSTYQNICARIYDMGLEASFEMTKNPLQITYKPTGQMIVFRGLNNATSINSIEFTHGYLTDIYIEEAFEVADYMDFMKLDGSLRGKLPDGLFLQITCCMNTRSQETRVYTEFFKGNLEDDYDRFENAPGGYLDYLDEKYVGPFGRGLYLHRSTFRVNEFRDAETYDVAAAEMKRKAPELYKVNFLGMRGNATEAVYPEFNQSLVRPIQDIIGEDEKRQPRMRFADFAIGIDTGLSSGAGKRKTVTKGETVETRVKSATTMQLCAITSDYTRMVTVDEYFHSNDRAFNSVNTDNRESMTEPQLMEACISKIAERMRLYGMGQTILMKGTINVYVDCADLGFRQGMEIKAREHGLFNLRFFGSTKLSIQSRVDFERLMMAYGDFIVSDRCPNLQRELRNSRRGEKGEAREDTDDHAINANEYAFAPLLPQLRAYKEFKMH